MRSIDLALSIFAIKIKWMRQLSREEQVFLETRATMRELAMFRVIAKIKGIDYKDVTELERDLSEYLNIIMILNSVSPDPKDIQHIAKHGIVPMHITKIVQGVSPYKLEIYYSEEYAKRIIRYRVDDYYSLAYEAQEKMKREVPKKYYEILGEIFDYYNFSALAFAIKQQRSLKEFDFEDEHCQIYKYLVETYSECPSEVSEDKKLFYAALKNIIKRKEKQKAA
jgi:hypothetical protein